MSKQNTWAGPDHWKYRKAKAPKMEEHGNENGSPIKRRKARTKEKPEADIDFTAALKDDSSSSLSGLNLNGEISPAIGDLKTLLSGRKFFVPVKEEEVE
ncbi:hypothetical protein Droror1_Dr00000212 [Drosera rotundifolia]